MLTIKLKKSYRKRDGSVGFIYIVTGDDKMLKEYTKAKVAQGLPEDKVNTKDGVIYYTNNHIGQSATLEKSENGNWYPNTTEFDTMISIQRQIHAKKNAVTVEAE